MSRSVATSAVASAARSSGDGDVGPVGLRERHVHSVGAGVSIAVAACGAEYRCHTDNGRPLPVLLHANPTPDRIAGEESNRERPVHDRDERSALAIRATERPSLQERHAEGPEELRRDGDHSTPRHEVTVVVPGAFDLDRHARDTVAWQVRRQGDRCHARLGGHSGLERVEQACACGRIRVGVRAGARCVRWRRVPEPHPHNAT